MVDLMGCTVPAGQERRIKIDFSCFSGKCSRCIFHQRRGDFLRFHGKGCASVLDHCFKVRERGRMSFLISRVQAGFVPLSFHERPIVRGGFFKMETPADQPVYFGVRNPFPHWFQYAVQYVYVRVIGAVLIEFFAIFQWECNRKHQAGPCRGGCHVPLICYYVIQFLPCQPAFVNIGQLVKRVPIGSALDDSVQAEAASDIDSIHFLYIFPQLAPGPSVRARKDDLVYPVLAD